MGGPGPIPGSGRPWPGSRPVSHGKWLVGIRHQVHDEEDPDWVARPEIIRGIRAVGAAGLAYDLLPRTRELPACLTVVDANPGHAVLLSIILPSPVDRQGGKWSPGPPRLKALADRPNVHCKLSGMVTEAEWTGWKPEHLKPYVDHVLDCFGPDRVMFGSDWPVCLLAADYATVKNTLEDILGRPTGRGPCRNFRRQRHGLLSPLKRRSGRERDRCRAMFTSIHG